jgi:hypothetical protein
MAITGFSGWRLLWRLFLIVLIGTGAIYGWEKLKGNFSWFSGQNQTLTSHNVVLKEITAMGKLELVRYNFRDVVEHEIVKQFLPNSKALLIIQGEAIGCLDLTKIRETDIATLSDSLLVIHLPEPELCTVKIDHQKSKVYNTEFAFLDEALLIEQAFKQAEGQVQRSAIGMGILDQTKTNAEKILKPLLEKISGKKVRFNYRPKASLPSPK